MNLADTRRNLTARIAADVRHGHAERAEELRAQLLALTVESEIRRRLDGRVLTEDQVTRLCEVLREYGPDVALRAEVEELRQRLDALLAQDGSTEPARVASSA